MSKKSPEWNRLDNAAKIFPSNTGKRDTKVFRFSCELYEEVVPEFLQQALDITVAYFPIFRSVMKRVCFGIILSRAVWNRSSYLKLDRFAVRFTILIIVLCCLR